MDSLIVYDKLWAPDGYQITDERLIKLINSKTVKRMEWIGQNGPLNHKHFHDNIISSTTRYAHSIGVMILALKVGGTIEEAIAGLLHDIIHTPFSHTIDFIVKEHGVSYHEKHKDRLLEQFQDELESILGVSWKRFLNEENWLLIKKNNPFAIDIADCTARDSVTFNICTADEVRLMATYLSVNKNRHLITTNIFSSNWWNNLSQKINKHLYASPWNYAMNHYLAMALKEIIDNGHLTMEKLEKGDCDDIEKNAFELALNTVNGKMFEKVNTFNWEFFPQDHELETNWTLVGSFDVRWRIVSPPINNNNKNDFITKAKKIHGDEYDYSNVKYHNENDCVINEPNYKIEKCILAYQ